MAASVWKQLGSLEYLHPPSICVHGMVTPHSPLAYTANAQSQTIVVGKMVCIDIEVIDTPLNYNIILVVAILTPCQLLYRYFTIRCASPRMERSSQ